MRKLVYLVLQLTLLSAGAGSFAADDPHAELLSSVEKLVSADPKVRQQAAASLKTALKTFPLPKDRVGIDLTPLPVAIQKKLVAGLRAALKHEDSQVVEGAVEAAQEIGQPAAALLDDLTAVTVNPRIEGSLRFGAACAMYYVAPETQAVTPLLFPVLKTFKDQEASEGLGTIGFWSTPVVEALYRSGHTKSEVPHFISFTTPEYPLRIRVFTLIVLAELGPEAKSVLPALRELLKDDNASLRMVAAGAILSIERESSVIPGLVEEVGLTGEMRDRFEAGCRTIMEHIDKELAQFAEMDEQLARMFVAMAKSSRGPERRMALRSLAAGGKAFVPAIPELQEVLLNPDTETRQLAADAIEHLERLKTVP